MYSYIIITIIILLIIFLIFIYLLNKKIDLLESKIINIFSKRTDTISALYEITKGQLTKHDEIFKDIIYLKKEEFYKIDNNKDLFNILETENLIHKELNFILRIIKTNRKLAKNNKFLYINEIIINKSFEIWNTIDFYRQIIKKFNNLITIKNLTIIWLFIPIYKKEEI